MSCEEAMQHSIDEFIKPDRDAAATSIAGEKAAQICLAEYGEVHENTIMALNNAGAFFMLASEPQKALAAYERSLKILQKSPLKAAQKASATRSLNLSKTA